MKIRISNGVMPLVFIALIYLLAGFVDPCDGHSCDQEVTDVRR